ncbi:hypothetical protein [Micromonospora carbonacea]
MSTARGGELDPVGMRRAAADGLYQLFESAGNLAGFWLAIAAQCLLLPPVVILADRMLRRPAPEPTGVS